MKIILAQLNNTVGDIEGNASKAIDVLEKAQESDVDLVVFSELFLSGYPPEDLVLKNSFIERCKETFNKIVDFNRNQKLGFIMGLPIIDGLKLYNAAALVDAGSIIGFSKKINLPNYSVFDEKRVFSKGKEAVTFDFRGLKLGVPICEDIWEKEVCLKLKEQKCDLIISPNGSPFDKYKINKRKSIIKSRVKETKIALLYVNQIGGQDELVFDGNSLAINPDNEIIFEAPSWKEDITAVEFDEIKKVFKNSFPKKESESALQDIYMATVIGLRDYVEKNNFPGVILGLSGGIDSALCAAIAVDALGKDRVDSFMLPSKFTSDDSFKDSEDCARRLGISIETIAIEEILTSFEDSLSNTFKGFSSDITEENLQSRIRGSILMAVSNKKGQMLLTTGNKSEVSVGYSTLYGDMNGGFNPIKDIYKTEVYELAKLRNDNIPSNVYGENKDIIPQNIIEKEPTAELRLDQKDSDSLPPYEELDSILEGLVEYELSTKELEENGFSLDSIKKIENLLYISEYKRRQSAPGVKISLRNFGRDRRYPITNK
ncbi:MAG: NAD+ synthase, partial [Pseudomonadota bacterium]|nr:NAD+ synthase [Pseudomonadota bacterium]